MLNSQFILLEGAEKTKEIFMRSVQDLENIYLSVDIFGLLKM
jgi:hypothetical protein